MAINYRTMVPDPGHWTGSRFAPGTQSCLSQGPAAMYSGPERPAATGLRKSGQLAPAAGAVAEISDFVGGHQRAERAGVVPVSPESTVR